jgi:hypothetical protein
MPLADGQAESSGEHGASGRVKRAGLSGRDRDATHGVLGQYLVARICAPHRRAVVGDRKGVRACINTAGRPLTDERAAAPAAVDTGH